MNTRIYKIIPFFILIVFLSCHANLFAQPPGRQMKGFQAEKIEYFNEKLNLGDKESKEFWPVYEDLQHRLIKNMEEERNLLNYININYEALSEAEIESSLDKYFNLQNQRHDLKQLYNKKFIGIIGKRKTMKMYALEREFRLHVLQKFKQGRSGHGQGRNR